MAPPLKDMVDRSVVEDLAARFATVVDGFDTAGFVAGVTASLPDLELMPRIEAIARGIGAFLDPRYPTALAAVVEVARTEPPIGGFTAWPLCTFVEIFGVDHPEASLAAMEHLTVRASCEFALRPFLHHHFDDTYAWLVGATAHRDPAVRRLASEGTRPRLPWAARVPVLLSDPAPGLALLERLRNDPSADVRRSVANHLNDVAKADPDLVVATVRRWSAEDPPVDADLVAHALRTLVKQGHPGAMEVLGFTVDVAVEVAGFEVNPATVGMGDRVELRATIRSTGDRHQHVVVDFVVHHVTATGGMSPKVFKWTTLELPPGDEAVIRKRRTIQHASTRTYHPGWHRVDLQVAGRVVATSGFDVVV